MRGPCVDVVLQGLQRKKLHVYIETSIVEYSFLDFNNPWVSNPVEEVELFCDSLAIAVAQVGDLDCFESKLSSFRSVAHSEHGWMGPPLFNFHAHSAQGRSRNVLWHQSTLQSRHSRVISWLHVIQGLQQLISGSVATTSSAEVGGIFQAKITGVRDDRRTAKVSEQLQ